MLVNLFYKESKSKQIKQEIIFSFFFLFYGRGAGVGVRGG